MTITTESLGKRFNRDWIFKDLSYTFSSEHIYAITGPNGSGKSTLLQVLWGQMPPTTGQCQYNLNGAVVSYESLYQHISIATPYMELVEELTLIEHLQFHFKLRSLVPGMSIDDFLSRTYLQEARDKHVRNFSSGMKQRLKLGLAFFTNANILFLDEPSTNLDEQAHHWYIDTLNKMANGRLVLIGSNQHSEYPNSAIRLNLMDFKQGV